MLKKTNSTIPTLIKDMVSILFGHFVILSLQIGILFVIKF